MAMERRSMAMESRSLAMERRSMAMERKSAAMERMSKDIVTHYFESRVSLIFQLAIAVGQFRAFQPRGSR